MPVLTERRGRVLLIRLDRDAKLNAMDHAMTLGLDAAMNQLEDDAELWVGVLTGNGRAFSAGIAKAPSRGGGPTVGPTPEHLLSTTLSAEPRPGRDALSRRCASSSMLWRLVFANDYGVGRTFVR